MFIEINKNYEDVSERPADDTSCRQVSQRDWTRSAEDLIPETRTRPLINHRQPAESMGCAVEVKEPVGCDAWAYRSIHQRLAIADGRWMISKLRMTLYVCQEVGTRDVLL